MRHMPIGTCRFILRLPLLEAIATGIMSSQKSAPVAVTVISYVTKDVAQQGLFAIPAIVGQVRARELLRGVTL